MKLSIREIDAINAAHIEKTEFLMWQLSRRSAPSLLGIPDFDRPRHMQFAGETQITGADTWANETVQRHKLGTRGITKDGRVYRYALAGGVSLVAGNLIQGPAPTPNHLALTPSAASVGASSVTLTLGATAAAANLYAEGFLGIDTTPGNGVGPYGISGHAAIGSGGTGTINLDPQDPIQVALTGSSRVGLMMNPYSSVIVNPTTQTGVTAGVACVVITTLLFGWLQTWGPASVLINGTPAVGVSVIPGGTTAGSVDVGAVAAEVNTRTVGRMMQVGVSTKNNFVYLMITP